MPNYDEQKWKNEKDEDKSSIPIMLFLKNTPCCQKIGVTKEEFPTLDEFEDEAEKFTKEDYIPKRDFC